MQARVNSNKSESCPSIRIRNSIKTFTDTSRAGCKKATGDRCIAHIYEEEVHEWLRRPNHVLLWCHKFYHSMIQIRPLPPIQALLSSSIPVESLRHVVREIAHVTSPTMSMIKERHKRIDI